MEQYPSPEALEEAITPLYKSQIDDQIQFLLKSSNPDEDYSQDVSIYNFVDPISQDITDTEGRSILVLTDSQQAVQAEVLDVFPGSLPKNNPLPSWRYETVIRGWYRPIRGDLALHQFAETIDYKRSNEWIRSNPQKALKEIFTIAHSQHKKSVGPPYSIVHVILPRDHKGHGSIRWITKGRCPSWDESVMPEAQPLIQEIEKYKRLGPVGGWPKHQN